MKALQEPLFAHSKGVILGRVFHLDEETGMPDVYLVDDPHLPASEHYFLVQVRYYDNGNTRMAWEGYHGPVACYDGLAGGDMQEAFKQALAHYSKRQWEAGK